MTVATSTKISLEVDCAYDTCTLMADPLFEQLSSGRYDVCSVLPLPQDMHEWEHAHRTARRRMTRALNRGYYVSQFRREDWAGYIHAINISMPTRQGRPMATSYLTHQEYGPLPVYQCSRHAIRTWGVFSPQRILVGYLNMYRVGDLCLISQILGHGAHLKAEIMWLLFAVAMSFEIYNGPGTVIYNRHDSGTDGLRWFKERLGFTEQAIEWCP